MPETPRTSAAYSCSACVGHRSFPVEPTYGHPARNAQLLRDNSSLRDDTRGLNPEEAAIVIEHWDRACMNRGKQVLADILRPTAQATKRAHRPEVAQRIANCQDYLLEAWVRLGTQEATIWELIDLAEPDPERHQAIVGRRYPMAYETYRSYLKDVEATRRAEVQARLHDR